MQQLKNKKYNKNIKYVIYYIFFFSIKKQKIYFFYNKFILKLY